MGSKQSTANSPARNSAVDIHNRPTRANTTAGGEASGGGGTSSGIQHANNNNNNNNGSTDQRQRTRSLVVIPGNSSSNTSGRDSRSSTSNAIDVYSLSSGADLLDLLNTSFTSTTAHSLPISLLHFNQFKCPLCKKMFQPEDAEVHLVMCITKPMLHYNEDVLTEDKDEECVICLEELLKGNKIARLPCLCIYHKKCIDKWFEVNRSCPEHPAD